MDCTSVWTEWNNLSFTLVETQLITEIPSSSNTCNTLDRGKSLPIKSLSNVISIPPGYGWRATELEEYLLEHPLGEAPELKLDSFFNSSLLALVSLIFFWR